MSTDGHQVLGTGALLRWVWDSKERLSLSLDPSEGVFHVAGGAMERNGYSNCVSEGGEDGGAGGWDGWPDSLGSALPASSFTLITFCKPCAVWLGVLDRSLRPSALPRPDRGSGSYGKSRKEVDILWFVWTIWASLGGRVQSIIPGSPGRRREPSGETLDLQGRGG